MAQRSIYLNDDLEDFIRAALLSHDGLSTYIQRLIVRDIYNSGMLEAYRHHLQDRASNRVDQMLNDAVPTRKRESQ